MTDYRDLVEDMPVGLDRALLRVMDFHHGKHAAIGRGELVRQVANCGFKVHERAMREAIKQLRRQGVLICSVPGEDGGYYLAANAQEFYEFARMEFEGKIADMSQTLTAMRAAAAREFGEGVQRTLF